MSDELLPEDTAASIASPAGPDSEDVPSINDPSTTEGDDASSIAPGGNAADDEDSSNS